MRTEQEILAEMEAVRASRPELATLSDVNSSTSNVSFFQLLKRMWVLLVQMQESAWESFRSEVATQIALTRVGTLAWYADQVRAFQFGVPRIVRDGKLVYEAKDPSKEIVAHVCVVESSGRLLIKAAKADGVPLTTPELQALSRYVSQVKYAGVAVDVVSMEPDELKIVAVCKVDQQLIGADGVALGDSNYPAWDAIAASVKALPLDSILNNTALTDVVQRVPGVKDFVITESYIRRPGASQWIPYSREVESVAGHVVLHNDTLITYSA